VLNEVLQPCYTNFIGSPAIIRYSYPPLFGMVVIPALVVVLSLEDEERGDKPASSIDSSDQGNPLTITSLPSNWIETDICCSYHLDRPCYTNLEPSLVKVVGIFIKDTVLGFHIGDQGEPGLDDRWVTAEDPAVIARSRELRFDLCTACNEALYPVVADLGATARCQQLVCHAAYLGEGGGQILARIDP
jgi:hypothetical protein